MASEVAGVARLVNTLDPVTPLWYELEIERDGRRSRPVPPDVRLWKLTQVGSRYAVVTAFRGIRAGLILVDLVAASWGWLTPDDAASYQLVESSEVGGAASLRISRTALDSSATDWMWTGDEYVIRPVGSAKPSPAQLTVELRQWLVPGGTMEGLLLLPRRTHRPLPLVVDLHGGPLPGLRAGDLGHGGDWCDRGYAHFRPEFHSSGILGREAMWDQTRGQGLPDHDLEIEDVLLGTRQVVADSRIDGTRAVLIGFSYGGYLQRAPVRKTMITIAGQDHVFTQTGIQELIARSHAWISEVLDA
jgi:hypothetical protein